MKSVLKSAFVKEHKTLIPILEKGTLTQRKREAKKQRKELKEYIDK